MNTAISNGWSRLVHRVLIVLSAIVLLGVPGESSAGKGATYGSIQNAINSGNRDSIIAEIERAEKLPCGACIDLVKGLIDHEDPAVRDVAAWWLAKRAVREQVRDEMFDRLQHGDSTLARNAAEVLGRFMHPNALMALEIAMHDDSLDGEARAAAAAAIGRIGHPAGKGMLEAGLTSESARVRAAAAAALRAIRGNTEALAVIATLRDPDPEVVEQAILTVGALRESEASSELAALVTNLDQPARVRKYAAWALGRLGDGSVREALSVAAREDPSLLVRGAARSAYNNL